MSRIALSFVNASCAHCARLVHRALAKEEGIRCVEVDQANQQVLVDYDPGIISADAIGRVMERSGYPSRPVPVGPTRLSVSARVA